MVFLGSIASTTNAAVIKLFQQTISAKEGNQVLQYDPTKNQTLVSLSPWSQDGQFYNYTTEMVLTSTK